MSRRCLRGGPGRYCRLCSKAKTHHTVHRRGLNWSASTTQLPRRLLHPGTRSLTSRQDTLQYRACSSRRPTSWQTLRIYLRRNRQGTTAAFGVLRCSHRSPSRLRQWLHRCAAMLRTAPPRLHLSCNRCPSPHCSQSLEQLAMHSSQRAEHRPYCSPQHTRCCLRRTCPYLRCWFHATMGHLCSNG